MRKTLLFICVYFLVVPVLSQEQPTLETRPTDVPPAQNNLEAVAGLLELVIEVDSASAKQCLQTLQTQFQTGAVKGEQLAVLQKRLQPLLQKIAADETHALSVDAALLAVTWRDSIAIQRMQKLAFDSDQALELRLRAAEALLVADDATAVEKITKIVGNSQHWQLKQREQWFLILGQAKQAEVAQLILHDYSKYEAELKVKAIELLTQRPAWSQQLLTAIAKKELAASVVNASQILKLQATGDATTQEMIKSIWGNVRLERNPQRESVVSTMRRFLKEKSGDPQQGAIVFQKICGQCHKIHGQGSEVGPDITANGRASYEQLLSNVFDPSLVIGNGYQARVVATDDGRVFTGLLAEENEQRVILKVQGGKLETIARDNIEEIKISPLSLMPEGVENQLKPEEISDLFAFLVLDKPPTDPTAQKIPGAP